MTTPKVLLLLVAILLIAATVPPSLLRSDAPALEISTSIQPVTQDEFFLLGSPRVHPGTYRCRAAIHDEPGSHRVFSAKDIVIGPGESGETNNQFGPFTVAFKAKIAKTLDRAETVVTVTREGKIIGRQSSTVWLQRQTNAAQPVK